MSKLYILQGAPGAGKSTLARKMQARAPKTTVIVSKDCFREGRGQYWLPEQEPYINELWEFAIMRGLEKQYDVIVDSTNLDDAVINRLEQIGAKCMADIIKVPVYTTMEECIKRDQSHNRRHRVGQAVIERYFNKYRDKLIPAEPIEEEDEIDEITLLDL